MNAGQTLALAGLMQTQIEAETRGIPWLSDLPWFGSAFRHVREQSNEIELLIIVTPEFVDALDPQDVPPCGPGELTTQPNDVELYLRGYLEVPRNCDTCVEHGASGRSTFLLDDPASQRQETIMTPPQPSQAFHRGRASGSVATKPGWPQESQAATATVQDHSMPQPNPYGPVEFRNPR
jgi:pilus assembly protein CpaC